MMNKEKFYFFKKEKWFFESVENVPFDDTATEIGIKIKKKLYDGKSKYQKIEFFDTYDFGKILVLGGILQTAEKTEFVYHEMLCQTPMFLHPNPKNILIIGGGDGGSLREILKHKTEKVVMVEIDQKVMDLSEKFLPSLSKGAFKNKMVKIIAGDGKEYIKKHKNKFDVIILDLSDPHGPATELIGEKFYKDVKDALTRDGVVSIQSASFTCQSKLVKIIFKRIKKIFPYVEIRKAVVPEYQAGEYSFTIGSKYNLNKITFKDVEKKYKKLNFKFKYYNPEIHFSSKILSNDLKDVLK